MHAISTPCRTALAFLTLPKIGPAAYWQWRNRCAELLKIAPAELTLLGDGAQLWRDYCERGDDSSLGREVNRQLALAERLGVALICADDSDYPELLKKISRPPPVIYLWGDRDCLELPQIALVGSRRATPQGQRNACDFARELAAAGFAITSGLALGIDASAHRATLACGGKTLAVLGTGLDNIYPARHRQLAQQIVAGGGLLVSEFAFGSAPRPSNFPRRNRIISGLSLGTLVIEASEKSGSLITARLAGEQGREVFALPGSIHNVHCRGCNELIRAGATLVERADQIVAELGGMLQLKQQQLPLPPTPNSNSAPEGLAADILRQLGDDWLSVDELVERLNRPTAEVLEQLLALELDGQLAQVGGGYQALTR